MVHLGSVKCTCAFQKPAVTTQWSQGTICASAGTATCAPTSAITSIANQDGSVVNGGIGGRYVDARMLDGQRALRQLQRRMRSVARIELHEPDGSAGQYKNNQHQYKKTKDPADASMLLNVQRGYATERCRSCRHSRVGTRPGHCDARFDGLCRHTSLEGTGRWNPGPPPRSKDAHEFTRS